MYIAHIASYVSVNKLWAHGNRLIYLTNCVQWLVVDYRPTAISDDY